MKSVHKIHFSPQVSIQKQLSQYFRNQRRTSKALGTSGPHRGNPTSKKAKVSWSEEDDEIAIAYREVTVSVNKINAMACTASEPVMV